MVITNQLLTDLKTSMLNQVGSAFLYGSVGSSSVTPAASDVRLGNEVFRSAVDTVDRSVTDKITTSLEINTTEANGNTLREFGWFETSAGSSGTAFVRDTFTAITKTSDINLFLDTTISFELIEV